MELIKFSVTAFSVIVVLIVLLILIFYTIGSPGTGNEISRSKGT